MHSGGSCSAGQSAPTKASRSRWPRRLRAAELAVREAAWRIDNNLPCGEQANLAKFLAADAAYAAADAAVQTHGGFGYASEYHVERYWREARLMRIAPVPQEMV